MLTTSITNYTHILYTPSTSFCSTIFPFFLEFSSDHLRRVVMASIPPADHCSRWS